MTDGYFQLPDREKVEFKSRIIMQNFKWLVPKAERPEVRIPEDRGSKHAKSYGRPGEWGKKRSKSC